MRTEIEWVETVEAGWNVVLGADREKIVEAAGWAIAFRNDVYTRNIMFETF